METTITPGRRFVFAIEALALCGPTPAEILIGSPYMIDPTYLELVPALVNRFDAEKVYLLGVEKDEVTQHLLGHLEANDFYARTHLLRENVRYFEKTDDLQATATELGVTHIIWLRAGFDKNVPTATNKYRLGRRGYTNWKKVFEDICDELRTCWCPCDCACSEPREALNDRGLCLCCAEGRHEIPPEGATPSVEDLLTQHRSITAHFEQVLAERAAAKK